MVNNRENLSISLPSVQVSHLSVKLLKINNIVYCELPAVSRCSIFDSLLVEQRIIVRVRIMSMSV